MSKASTAQTFNVGQDVTWTSQAQGSATKKTGTVVAVLSAGQSPLQTLAAMKKKHGARSAWGGGGARDHASYFVLVPGGKTDKAKPVLYWPNAKALRPVVA